MKKFYSVALALIATMLCMPASWAAKHRADEKPIVTIYSDAYNIVGESNAYQIRLGADLETAYFDIDYGNGTEEVEVAPWGFDEGAIKATNVAIHVNPDGIIKIYGDPTQLAYLDIEGIYATKVEFSACTELQALDFSHNPLEGLDLTPFTKLMAVYLEMVEYAPDAPLIVGGPKPDLIVLGISGCEYLDPNFDLKNYPNLIYFDGYHARGLKSLDPTGCPNLQYLNLDMTDVATLDLSKNPKLLSLDISNTPISEIDLSANTQLINLLADHQSGWINVGSKLNSIDLSHNPELVRLNLAENWLTEIDLSANTKLTNLNLKNNSLKALDLSKNVELYSINISNNNLNFATLPAPQATWGEYFYEQQNIPVARSYAVGSSIDLSSQVLREGTTTTAKIMVNKVAAEAEELPASAYTYADGVITLNEIVADSLTVYYYNSLLNEYPLFTTRFKVKAADEIGKPIQMATFTVPKGTEFKAALGVAGATADNPKKLYVTYGDSEMVEYNITTHEIPEEANISGSVMGTGKVTVYVDDNCALSAIGVDGVSLTSVDFSKATELAFLSITNCGLRSISLTYNRCLQALNLSHNNLAALNLSGPYGNMQKTVLRDIDVSYNQLKSITIVATRALQNFNASHNLLQEYDFTNYDQLLNVDMSYNQLTGEVSLTYPLDIQTANFSNNRLNSLKYDTLYELTDLDLSNNYFTFETLPLLPSVATYTYAPQLPVELVPSAPAINLSYLNRVVNGKGTTYVWKNEAGQTLVQGVDVDCVNGGTKFLKEDLGKVYCEMTNPAFPQFAGENVLKTTLVQVVGKPTNVITSFTTTQDANTGSLVLTGYKKGSIFIDWRGDGTEYLPYEFIAAGSSLTGVDYTTYSEIQTYEGANVKVYTYDDVEDLSGITFSNIEMSEFDATPLTKIFHLSIAGANLPADKIKLPKAPLTELNLSGNTLTEYPFLADYPDLVMLNVTSNKLTSIDISSLKSLQVVYLGGNEMTSLKCDNPVLWHLGIESNKFETLDLSGLPKLDQLIASNNLLSEIDLSPVKGTIRNLMLNNNRFTFATLPIEADYPTLTRYIYNNQALVEAKVSDDFMSYDLSSQAEVNGTASDYTWFLGQPVYDADSGQISGEILYVDDEYDLTDGVTTFKTKFNDVVVCVITNEVFPKAFMMTPPYTVGYSGIDSVVADEDKLVDVYTVYGLRVKVAVPESEAFEGLAPGYYIVGKKKVYVK